MGKFLAFISFLAALAMGAAWYAIHGGVVRPTTTTETRNAEGAWLADLYRQNPRETEAAARRVAELGDRALPTIRATLQDPHAEEVRRKAALKACAILGPLAAPAIPDVVAQLPEPGLTAEAAIALSFMGRGAFVPLRSALASENPVVRREALRSIGKLRARASLDAHAVLPLLIGGMQDGDAGVRVVAVTYLGILNEEPDRAIPALIQGLADADVAVKTASAAALGSFGEAAQPAVPALREAAGDPDEDLAREAGRALVKLQSTPVR